MSCVVFQIPNADRVTILDPKELLIYPFQSSNWLDLRLGAFISITSLADNDTTTGLSESLPPVGTIGTILDRVVMGFGGPNVIFGLSNSGVMEANTPSVVEADPVDATKRWRYKGIANKAIIVEDGSTPGTLNQDNAGTIFGPELSQNPDPTTGTGGRASLFMLRMKRASGTSLTISNFYYVNTARGGVNYADANVFSDNPTLGLIRQNFRSATWTPVLAAATLTAAFTQLLFYWPFMNSRLRIHSLCIEKFA